MEMQRNAFVGNSQLDLRRGEMIEKCCCFSNRTTVEWLGLQRQDLVSLWVRMIRDDGSSVGNCVDAAALKKSLSKFALATAGT